MFHLQTYLITQRNAQLPRVKQASTVCNLRPARPSALPATGATRARRMAGSAHLMRESLPLCVRTHPTACCVLFVWSSGVGEVYPPALASVPLGERRGCSDVLEPRTPWARPRHSVFVSVFQVRFVPFEVFRFSFDYLVVVLKTGAGGCECGVPALCRIEHYQRITPQPRPLSRFHSLFTPC